MSVVLVVNSGSSSFKYQLIDMDHEVVLASGLVERIGEESGLSAHTVFHVILAIPLRFWPPCLGCLEIVGVDRF